MRKDMKKILCETYRSNSGGKNGDVLRMRREKFVLYEDEDGNLDVQDHAYGGKVTSIRQRSWESAGQRKKFFGENLAPLRRWIASQVGRNWNDIWSEISEVCPKGNPVNSHIYQHLWGYIERDVELIDGKIRSKMIGWSGSDQINCEWCIHPETNILIKTPAYALPAWRKKKKKVVPSSWFKLEDKTYIRRDIDGCWFEIIFRVDDVKLIIGFGDIFRNGTKEVISKRGFDSAVKQGVPIPDPFSHFSLRTLSRNEKKTLGLA